MWTARGRSLPAAAPPWRKRLEVLNPKAEVAGFGSEVGVPRCSSPDRVQRAEGTVGRSTSARRSFRALWARGWRRAPALPASTFRLKPHSIRVWPVFHPWPRHRPGSVTSRAISRGHGRRWLVVVQFAPRGVVEIQLKDRSGSLVYFPHPATCLGRAVPAPGEF
jgi:hypothetical protein